jgi:hypothetical protein
MIIQPLSRDAAAASPPISNIFLMVLLSMTHQPQAGNDAVGILSVSVMLMVFRDDHDDLARSFTPMFMDDAAAQKDGRRQRQQDHTFHIHS